MNTRDIIVIGASMGGVEALSALVAQLPEDLPAAVCVVQHTGESSPGLLADLLDRKGPLAALRAQEGTPPERGHIYVAPPGRHLLLTEGGLRVVYGPRENRSRPAIDPLFRTAAVSYRSRVIGVILTGLLGDGASGLRAVKQCGGMAVVQADADYPEMPRQALAAVDVDHETPLSTIGKLLNDLAREAAPEPPPVPKDLLLEARLTERAMSDERWQDLPGHLTSYTCPDCGGTLREIEDGGLRRYRCHVGHAFTADVLLQEQERGVEETLWAALRMMEDRSAMLEDMARDEEASGRSRMATDYEEHAEESRTHANRLRTLLQQAS